MASHMNDNLPVLRDFKAIINGTLTSFVTLSRKIGGELPTMIDHVTRLFDAQQKFIEKAIQSKKPTNDQEIQGLVKPQSTEIEAICAYTNQNRKSPLFNHLSAISEGIPALGWILVSPTPAPYIKEMSDAAQFYANRVLKEFKEKDPTHVEWVKQWITVLSELHAYVKQYHTTGLTWSVHGQQGSGAAAVPTGKSGSAAPPPPPPPPPPPSSSLSSAAQAQDGQSRAELMDSINALGTDATSHLKKVPDQLKLHKNAQLRDQTSNQSAARSNIATKSQETVSQTSSTLTSGPPKLALEGNKWVVEFHSGRHDLKITDTNMKQTVYVYKCSNSTLTIQGKVNSIVLDQCNKVGLQFTSAVSLVEFINCRGMKVQVLDQVPTIQIEKTDGCHVFLSKTSLDTQFITSKSSEMTINIPFGDGEYKELPVPEQFKTHLKGGKELVTVPNESSGV
ncbi:unnamed protein product [Rotaria sordida]|uniref:C-CAP/cofactor C-like domain-containing protein n=1 Tax=Rotaria sordida TaxID=392033 RepID=A0A814EG48_9BILA|nr:unnamed protein product [Rotaria sordida]CAF1122338.1 unnamed protein product [Rotaria sordida]